jgi:hypothetical protein
LPTSDCTLGGLAVVMTGGDAVPLGVGVAVPVEDAVPVGLAEPVTVGLGLVVGLGDALEVEPDGVGLAVTAVRLFCVLIWTSLPLMNSTVESFSPYFPSTFW